MIGVFDDLLQKERLDKRDIGLIAERITVFEDHLNVKLRSDVDELLSLGNEAHTVNFPSDSRDNVISQSSAKRADKVFTVHVISSGPATDNIDTVRKVLPCPVGAAWACIKRKNGWIFRRSLPVSVRTTQHLLLQALCGPYPSKRTVKKHLLL